jgi:2-keto-4-pentenoate hydratase/2-oxohepta-3-ene-1,7-dioic acid hydratase in catechol pathway
MKIIRYQMPCGEIFFGEWVGESQADRMEGDLFSGSKKTGQRDQGFRLLAPLVPTSILCIGLNYRLHAEETKAKLPKYPILFMKSVAALQNPGGPIEIPMHLASEQVDYEGELAVVIGRRCKNVSRENALDYVLGYTCANDVSARDWQLERGGSQWCRGKGFDTFCPLGPCIVTRDEIPDPQCLGLKTVVNGVVVQDSNTRDMIFSIASLIEFLSGSTTLMPGTVIMTGTPQGVGMAGKPPLWLKEGDQVAVEIEKVGVLKNEVKRESVD